MSFRTLANLIRPSNAAASKFGLSSIRCLTTSKRLDDLMEFFDEKNNWGVQEVRSGRSWRKEELRLKSNSDLHKLWYVLLKERNMLLTMEEESKERVELFPSPERIDKVEESMENLEAIVRERNVAYHQLETGEMGERVTKEVINVFGLPYQHTESEYPIPKHKNTEWLKKHNIKPVMKDMVEFLRLYKEKQYVEKRNAKTRDFNHVIGLLKRFPDMDMEALRQQYPDVDIEKAKRNSKSRGHFVPK